MIYVTPEISIHEKDITFDFVHASGPGGQHVNKVATAVQLRFDVKGARVISDDFRARLMRLAGKRVTEDGILIIQAKRYRTQEQNRKDAVARLVELMRKASVKKKPRKKTRPTLQSKRRLMEAKKHRQRVKRMRGRVYAYDD